MAEQPDPSYTERYSKVRYYSTGLAGLVMLAVTVIIGGLVLYVALGGQ